MEKGVGLKGILKRFFSHKFVIHLSVFVLLGIIMVIAGNVIVQDGSLTTTDNLTVQGELAGTRTVFCFTDPNTRTADTFALFGGVPISTDVAPVMWRSGKVVGFSTLVEIGLATSGNLEIRYKRLMVNGSQTDFATFQIPAGAGTGVHSNYTTISRASAPVFNAGDKIGVKEAETGTMGWGNLIACMEVQFDS